MLGGGGFTPPGFNPDAEASASLVVDLQAGNNIKISPVPPDMVRIDAYATGSTGEVQWCAGPPDNRFAASHKLVWLDLTGTLQVENQIDLVGANAGILINGVPQSLGPGGADGMIQINDNGEFKGTYKLTWNETTSTLEVQHKINVVGPNPEIMINGVPLELPKSFLAGPNIQVQESIGVPPTVTVTAIPSGIIGAIQFHDEVSGQPRFAGTSRLKWDNTLHRLEVQGDIYLNGAPIGAGGGASHVTVSETPPASPVSGELWFDAKSTQMFIWYVDPTSAQWVVAINESGLLRDAPKDGKRYLRKDGFWVEE